MDVIRTRYVFDESQSKDRENRPIININGGPLYLNHSNILTVDSNLEKSTIEKILEGVLTVVRSNKIKEITIETIIR